MAGLHIVRVAVGSSADHHKYMTYSSLLLLRCREDARPEGAHNARLRAYSPRFATAGPRGVVGARAHGYNYTVVSTAVYTSWYQDQYRYRGSVPLVPVYTLGARILGK